MQQVLQLFNASVFFRTLMSICDWFGAQWQKSGIIQWFLHPSTHRAQEDSAHSILFKVWSAVRSVLCKTYAALHLDKLFHGSMFLQTWLWCAIPVFLAPILCVFRPSLMIFALALIAYASLLLRLVQNRAQTLVWTPINRYVLLFAGVYLAGTLFSVNLSSSLQPGMLSVGFILFAVVLVNAVSTRKQLHTLVVLMILAATLVSFYGILQYLFGWGYQSAAWVDSDMFSSITFRVPSTLDNPNMLGQYLILLIPLGAAKLFGAKGWGTRIFYLGCCAIMTVCMLLTFSRGAWLGLLFALALFAVMMNPRLVILAPFALIALYFLLPDTIISRFTSIGNLTDNSTSYRVYIWMGVLAMLKDYWLCGIGPGDAAFNMVYPAYSYTGIAAPHAHNLFLQLVCDAGIAALLVFLLLLFVYFRSMCSVISSEKKKENCLLQIAFTTGLLGFLVQAMTDYSFYNYRVMFIFWVYLAMGVISARAKELHDGGIFA